MPILDHFLDGMNGNRDNKASFVQLGWNQTELGNFYDYGKALSEENSDLLKNRRQEFCLKLAIQQITSEKTQDIFPKREKEYRMQA